MTKNELNNLSAQELADYRKRREKSADEMVQSALKNLNAAAARVANEAAAAQCLRGNIFRDQRAPWPETRLMDFDLRAPGCILFEHPHPRR
ncbi:MAG: hypothetical protein ABSB35_01755 [Bryobacteraceae bacterium]|jgi:hypothetical protein